MNLLDRWLIGILTSIIIALLSWTMATVVVNTSRISVLEQRTSNHQRQMHEMKDDIRDHRQATEHAR